MVYFLVGHGDSTWLVIGGEFPYGAKAVVWEAFKRVQFAHPTTVGLHPWPSKQQLKQILELIAAATSSCEPQVLGHTIVRMIGDDAYGDPIDQLHGIIDILNTCHNHWMSKMEAQAFIMGDLHKWVISRIPLDIRPVAYCILACIRCCVWLEEYHNIPVMLQDIAKFLDLDLETVDRVVRAMDLITTTCDSFTPVSMKSDFCNYIWFHPPSNFESLGNVLAEVESGLWVEMSTQYIHWCNHLLASLSVQREGEHSLTRSLQLLMFLKQTCSFTTIQVMTHTHQINLNGLYLVVFGLLSLRLCRKQLLKW